MGPEEDEDMPKLGKNKTEKVSTRLKSKNTTIFIEVENLTDEEEREEKELQKELDNLYLGDTRIR